MDLSLLPYRVVETVERRTPGAFQLADAVTELPLTLPATVEARRMTMSGATDPVPIPRGALSLLRNRRGAYVVFRAPLFDTYVSTFDAPPTPIGAPITLHVSVTDAGPDYLPQQFQLVLPRSLDPAAEDTVLEPRRVGLLRTPAAGVQDGWVTLRVRVTQRGTNPPRTLPGVLVRVFRTPRAANERPIGVGMTEWRGRVRGEALVPVVGLQRFRPGNGAAVIETDHTIEFDTTRDRAFTGGEGEIPNVPRIAAGTGTGIVRTVHADLEITRPDTPVRVEAGREYVVNLAMP